MEGYVKIVDRQVIRVSREKLADTITDKFFGKDVVLVCILKGAAYFTIDLSRVLEQRNLLHSIYFIEASSYNNQTQQEDVDLLSTIVSEKLVGKHVVLLDELYDNGKTMNSIKQHIINLGTSITTCVMFQKNGKLQQYELPDLVGMMVPNVWIVGYGLDDNGLYRGLSDLYAKPKDRTTAYTSDDWRIFINKE